MAGEYMQPSKESPEGDKQINFGVASKFEVSHDRSNEVGLIRKHQKEVVTLGKSEVPVKGVSSSDSSEAFPCFPNASTVQAGGKRG